MSRSPGVRATSADVARLAGVSRATVSYVVNGVTDVKIAPETRRRVLDAAAELGYSQYGPGRTLKSGRSDIVLFVLNDLPVGHALNTMLDELEGKLAANELSLVLFRMSQRGNSLSRIWREIGPRAVVGIEAIEDRDAAEMRAAGIDVVRLNLSPADGPGVLTQSQTEVGEAQVRYLAERGHHRLGFAYPDDPRVVSFAVPRLQGASAACEELGLPPIITNTIPMEPDAAAAAVMPWLSADAEVSGICAYNDLVAFAVLAALRRHHVRVPDDIAVIGVDNDPIGALVNPSLTTVDTEHVSVADELARLVVERPDPDAPPAEGIARPIRIVVRDSA